MEDLNNRTPDQTKFSNKLIEDVDAIQESRSQMFSSRKDIEKYVEGPLVSACQYLWDANIRTLSSTANRKDAGDYASITVDWESLSEHNKRIIEEEHLGSVVPYDGQKVVFIAIPVKEDTQWSEVEDAFLGIATRLSKQKMTWAPTFTLETMHTFYGIDPSDTNYGVEDFTQEGWYYDAQSQLFYLSEEHFLKATESFEEDLPPTTGSAASGGAAAEASETAST